MIDVKDVKKIYRRHVALDGVSLSIEKGEAFALLGPNGAGKSTLVRLISTLSRPDQGAITVNGFDTVKEAGCVRRSIEVVFQENALDRDLTLRQNLLFHARLRRLPDAARKVAELLERVGLAAWADHPVSHLSGGMQRRMVIGRALLSRPDVLLLDEPTTGLDPGIRRDLWQFIRSVHADGCTIVLTTHYIEEAESLCSRVGIINHGRVMAEGAPNRLVAEYRAERLEDVVVSLGVGK